MEAKNTDWRPGPTVCRCCLTEGCYKDISTEYFWMGKREVYAEMLSDTLNVSIAYSQSGGPNSNSRLICEPCISRLRDACDFKRQVLECEKTFMQDLDPSSSNIEPILDSEGPLEILDSNVKLEPVKLEKNLSDDDFGDDRDFDDDDDDMDDEPLTKLASRLPKRESVDLMDLLDNTKATEKRKSSTKTKVSHVKKSKMLNIDAKPSPSTAPKTEKKKKELNPMNIAKRNAQTIIRHTTAYPFRIPESSIVCVYCCDNFDDGPNFREHMDSNHKDFNIKCAFAHLQEGFIKADCSNLRCRICSESFFNLEEAAKHLNDEHSMKIDIEFGVGIQPFRLEKNRLSCDICGSKSSNIRSLSRHIQKHFFQCTCELCGKSFATSTSLQKHIESTCPNSLVPKKKRCRKCKIVITSSEHRQKHYELSAKCRPHLCSVCGERFNTWKLKRQHMEEAHAIPKKVYPCPECDLVYKKPDSFRAHFKIAHTNEHFECPICERKFDSKYVLDRHMVVHSNERSYSCDVCKKSFPRKYTLKQHMWIHSEVKRWECKICSKQFNQKISWKTHIRSYHPDVM